MAGQGRLPVNTVIHKEQSIWRDIGRDVFRKHIVDLQRASHEVPADPVVHSTSKWLAPRTKEYDGGYILPFHVEQRLADDFAFLAAAEEGPKEVSAVTVEERVESNGLTILLAVNEKIPSGVENTMEAMLDLLSKCASRKLSRNTCAQSMFDLVIEPNQNRIHGRFKSVHWIKPKSRIHWTAPEPLYKGLRKVVRQLEQRKPGNSAKSPVLIQQLIHLCDSFREIDQLKKGDAKCIVLLKQIVKESHDLCTSNSTLTLDETLAQHGFEPREVVLNKHIRQVNKIGRYWGLCLSMAEDSRRYPDIFSDMKLKTLRPYEGATSSISLVPGQRARCLVHAEMQMIVFYGHSANAAIRKPRVIGASKSACYLCNLFNLHHGRYFITKTHGHLYERWNFPDLAEYSLQESDEYRRILSAMDTELQAATIRENNTKRRRQPPLGSWLTLPTAPQYSPVPSTVLGSLPDLRLLSRSTVKPKEDNSAKPSLPRQSGPQIIHSPMSQSPPPAYTATLHSTASNLTASPEPQESVLPAATPHLPLRPSSSIESWEYPIHRTITAATPFSRKSNKVSILFEIERPALGSIAISDTLGDMIGVPVNVWTMKEGETLSLKRKDEDNHVSLDLHGSDGKTTHLELRWLWNEQAER